MTGLLHDRSMEGWSGLRELDEIESMGMRIIGIGVRRGRLARGLSQRQLAWRAGVSQSLISRLENGRLRGLRLRTLARIVGVLRIDPDRVFVGDPPAPRRCLPGQASTSASAALP